MEKRSKLPIYIILGVLVVIVSGCVAQFVDPTINGTFYYDDWGVQRLQRNFSVNPIVILRGVFSKYGIVCAGFMSIVIGIIIWVKKLNEEEYSNMDERNFKISSKGTYGTAGWMTSAEIKKVLSVKSISETDGTILGVDIKTGKVISLPLDSRLNRHTAIFGASGTGKSRCFVRNQISQCALRGESVIVTDPKGELFADSSNYLRKKGYKVRIFNLVDPKFSDSWNCLNEIRCNPDQIELMSQTFADVIIKNTGGNESKDPFWDTAEMNLLKALCLLVALDERRDESQKTIGAVYEMLTNNDEKRLDKEFSVLRQGHPAKAPWAIFKQAGDNVRGNVIIGLGARMQVFQSSIIKSITAHTEIDLEAPAKEKCAYYVIMSDQDSTLDFLSSLFFSFLFIRLVRYADIYGKNGKCDTYVNFILDEFPNIGQIPDFTKKLSTIRSRELRVAIIFQNIAQLQNRYPNGLYEEILGNCDTHLFLGCTDETTAKFISTRTGEMTIDVNSTQLNKVAMTPAGANNLNYRETQSVGKRFVLTPDEVLRWDNQYVLIIIRGQKVLKALKFDFSKNPEWDDVQPSNVREYTPQWRAMEEAKKFSLQKEEEDTKNEEIAAKVYSDDGKNPGEEEKAPDREVVATIKPKAPSKLYSKATKQDSFDDF